MNLIGGMYQRLDGCRKHLFGMLLMFKEKTCEEEHYSISGVWLQRGQNLIFPAGEELGWNYDAEHYHFRKLDPLNKPEDKNCIESYLEWEGDYLAGREVDDGKAFK